MWSQFLRLSSAWKYASRRLEIIGRFDSGDYPILKWEFPIIDLTRINARGRRSVRRQLKDGE